MLKPRAIIELSPTTLVVTSWKPRGHSVSLSHIFAPLDLVDGWPESLSQLTDPLQALIAKAGLKGSHATVLYTSPTCASGVFSCPVAAGSRRAEQAAQLALADACELDLTINPFDLVRIAGDRPGSAAESGAPQQVHFLGAADEESSLAALANWVAAAGLKPDQFIPLESLTLTGAARAALRLADKHGPTAVLFASEHASALAAAAPGKLWFVRSLAVGRADLALALMRGIRRGADDAEPVKLDFADALQLLEKTGIPDAAGAAETIDPQHKLTGAHVLPLLQPVLQRWGVEIKQSLRFGLPKNNREAVRFALIGPARRVRRLEDIFTAQVALQPVAVGLDESHEAKAAWAIWQSFRRSSVSVVPRAMQSIVRAKEFRRMLAAGCAAAAAVVGANSWLTGRDLQATTQQIAQLRAEAEALGPASAAAQRVALARAGVDAATVQIDLALGDTPPWSDWLAALNAAVPDGVRVATIHLAVDGTQPVCTITGRTEPGSPDQTSGRIKAYLDQLAGVPLAQNCRIGRTERVGNPGRTFQTFEVSVQLIALPSIHSPALAGVNTDGQP